MQLSLARKSFLPSSMESLVLIFTLLINSHSLPIGGLTGAIEISITYPTEYTKTVMQLYPEINK
jgi:hypothetical protein